MSDPLIHDTTPQGSPILAYGETNNRDRRFWFFLVLPIILCLGIIWGLGYGFTRSTLPLPRSRALLAFIDSDVPLPPGSPQLWQEAQRAARPFPIFVGLTRQDDGRLYPFAVTPRVFSKEHSYKAGIWHLLTEKNSTHDIDLIRPREVVDSWMEYAAPAWLRIWPDQLRALLALPISTTSSSLGGPIKNREWKTDIELPQNSSPNQELNAFQEGFNTLNFDRLPDSWSMFQEYLQASDFPLTLDKPPASVAWKSNIQTNSPDLLFTFNEPPDIDTKAHIAAAAGIAERTLVELPDQSLSWEKRLPIETLEASTSSEWTLEDDRVLVFRDKAVFIGHASSAAITAAPVPCSGEFIGSFNQETLAQIRSFLGLEETLHLHFLTWTKENGKLKACW